MKIKRRSLNIMHKNKISDLFDITKEPRYNASRQTKTGSQYPAKDNKIHSRIQIIKE